MSTPLPKQPKVLLIESMYHEDGEAILAAHTEVQVTSPATADQIREAIRPASGVIVRYPSRLSSEAIMEGRNLVVISASGYGTDAIDIPAATEQNIAVVNNPGFGTNPVSEHTIALMLALTKQIVQSDSQVRHGDGWPEPNKSSRIELEGRTLGLIGLGRIGTEVARKCVAAFRMRVLAYDPYISPAKAESVGAILVNDLATVLQEADIVSLHAELTEETRGMIGEAELRKMRPGAFLINTARGAVVKQEAVVLALREGWIGGAALDVFDPEPPSPDSPLYGLDGLTLPARSPLHLCRG